jgi:hypothetical protein
MELSVNSSSTIPARKEMHITDHVVYDILNYVHPDLHLIIYYKMYQKDKKDKRKQNHLRFNISSLISLNCIPTLNEFESILMSFRFREHLAAIVSLHGDYSTILWFRDKEIFLDQTKLCKNAARRGNLGLFKSFMNEFDGDIYDIHEMIHDACKAAAQFGSKNILEFILFEVLVIVPVDKYNFLYDDEAATKVKMDVSFIIDELRKIAARFGRLNVLELIHFDNRFPDWLLKQRRRLFGASLIFDAVCGNQVEVLLWIQRHHLHELMASVERSSDDNCSILLCRAAENGNLCMVQWLAEKGFRCKDPLLTKSAAIGGNVEVLKFLLSLDCPMAEDVCIIAAENGHLELLKWAKLNRIVWQDAMMFPAAAKSIREDLHQWLLELHCPFMENESFPIAYELMNFNFIKFALANGSTVWDDDLKYQLRRTASLIGDLEVFKWAHSTACTSGGFLTRIQAYGGHVHILEWRRVHEFEFCWDKSALLTACQRGHIHVLEWAIDKYGCCDVIADECFHTALEFYRHCHLHLLSFIHSRWPNVLKCSKIWNRAAWNGDFELCFWLYKHGCPFLPDTYKIAWKYSNYALAKWLHSKEHPSSRWALKRTRRYIKQGF